ncbi:MAG: hypothetical protein ACXVBB_19000, partial [Isosphaeraceae bacterium]
MDQVVLGQQGEVVEDLPDLGLDQRQLPEAREEERQELDQVGIIVVPGMPEGNPILHTHSPPTSGTIVISASLDTVRLFRVTCTN